MFDVEFTLRAAAVVAAALLVASPSVVGAVQALLAWRPVSFKIRASGPEPETTDDAHVVLEIARRLQKSGNVEGVRLCKSLIDVLLKPEKKS
jgi:hypothetical protein